MDLLKLVSELRRRHVVRTAAAYMVAAWLVVQVAATVFPVLELPLWTTRFVVLLAILGLPITLALAWSFDLTPDGFERTAPATPNAAAALSPARPRRARALSAALLVVAVLAGSGWFVGSMHVSARAAALDSRLIAIAPFRVAGADASVAYLHEGLIDLIAVKLTGERRAVDPGSTLAAWRTVVGEGAEPSLAGAKRVAMHLGARHVLLGSVVGEPGQLTLIAALFDVASGRELATGSVHGPADELPALIDRLVATVLSLEAGENADRLTSLTSTSLEALRAYLEGNAHYRRARYVDAVASYSRALDLDSTFALAAMSMIDPASMEPLPGSPGTRGRRLARAHVDRLPPRDRAYFEARWPLEPPADIAEELEMLEGLVRQFPDRSEAWYSYADVLFHRGGLVDPHRHLERAQAGFERALALDSTHLIVVQHLLFVASRTQDSVLFFRFVDRYLDEQPTGTFALEARLRSAAWRQDTAAVRRHFAALDQESSASLNIQNGNQLRDARPLVGLTFARRAAELTYQRSATPTERNNAIFRRVRVELNAGRPAEAQALLDSIRRSERRWWPGELVNNALFLDGDTAAATEGAAFLDRRVRDMPDPLQDQYADELCAVTTLRLLRGETDGAAAAIARLRLPHAESSTPANRQVCAASLDALLGQVEGAPDARARLLALDALMARGPRASPQHRDRANIIAARLFEACCETQRAWIAAGRLAIDPGTEHHVSTFYEMQCRLGAALRRVPEATRACTRYITLRSDAEPHLLPRVEAARAAMAVLEEGGR
jgi:tetratricopeptide (TPR) repeat protein